MVRNTRQRPNRPLADAIRPFVKRSVQPVNQSDIMVLKEKDSQEAQLKALEKAIGTAKTDYERSSRVKELACARAGVAGEKETAYHIDFHFKGNRNWMVLHDLRLDYEGRVAQIDHLIVNRMLEMYVVESKNLKTKVRYENRGWERINGGEWEGFPCPIEQNRRHILVLKKLIETQKLSPTRLGLNLTPTYVNVVVVNPECSIVGKFPKDARVWKMDALPREARDAVGNPLSLLWVVSSETLEAFLRKLIEFHRPAPARGYSSTMEFRDVKTAFESSRPTPEAGGICSGCGGVVSKDEERYCHRRKAQFAGKALCRRCQNYVPMEEPKGTPSAGSVARCEECEDDVDGRVEKFCRDHSKRFDGRILCRKCQQKVGSRNPVQRQNTAVAETA